MIDDIEGFFEVHKQGTNGALVIKGFHPRMLDGGGIIMTACSLRLFSSVMLQ